MSFIIDPYRFGFTCPDADATAFILAAGITDDTQKRAICTLVSDLKAYGLWTKMRAIYPFCGSTANQQKFNLKDPRDLDAAFRLAFFGGGTHSSTGWTPNGVNGYGDTFLTPSTSISQNSAHLSFYSRTNALGNGMNIGAIQTLPGLQGLHMAISFGLNANQMRTRCNSANASTSYTPTDTRGLFSISRTTSTQFKGYKDNATVFTFNETSNAPANVKIVIGAINTTAGVSDYSTNQCAFASIGDGLTDTESTNLYIAVQKYQTTLGREIGVPIALDSDSQAFINAAGITDTIQQNAIIALVSDLKFNGLWTKMRAIYPFIGSTASTQKWNLKDPRDLDAAFRLVFIGGSTHASTGWTPNGVNGYANTFLNENTIMTLNNEHISFYSRSNTATNSADISVVGTGTESNIYPRFSNNIYGRIQGTSGIASANTDSRGLFIANRTNNTQVFVYKNTTKYTVSSNTVAKSNAVFTLGAVITTPANNFSDRECAFASIGDGLTDTEAANLYSSVQLYETSLNRQV